MDNRKCNLDFDFTPIGQAIKKYGTYDKRKFSRAVGLFRASCTVH